MSHETYGWPSDDKAYLLPQSAKKAENNVCICKTSKCFIQDKSYWEFKDYSADSVDPDEVAHYEPPHLVLHSLQLQLFLLFFLAF